MYPIYAFGSKEQKDEWIPKLASAEALGCFGLTEPDFGSNPAGMRTTARKDGDSYVLNGAKAWITSGSIADVAVVWAKLDGIVRLPVEKGTKGLDARAQGQDVAAHRRTSQLAFEDAASPPRTSPGVEGLATSPA
jgi:glutaryl-CoA dehydrogenase